MADVDDDVPRDVREQLLAAVSSDDPSTVEEALRLARPFASKLEQHYAAATNARERLSLEGTETARRLLEQAAQGDASTAEIQRAIIRFAPVLENAELQSLTRRLTDSLGSRSAAVTPRGTATSSTAANSPVIGRYRVIHKAVTRAGFELTSAAVDVLQPGRVIEVVERRSVSAEDDTHGYGLVRVRCADGTWLSVTNRSGEPLITELQDSSPLASPRAGSSSPGDRSRSPMPSEDGDTMFGARLEDTISQHAWAGVHNSPNDVSQISETPGPRLRLVKTESEQLQPTSSLRDFEEMEELAEREVGNDDHQRCEDARQNLPQTVAVNTPVAHAGIPLPSGRHSAAQSPDGSQISEAVPRPLGDKESTFRLLDVSLTLCKMVVSKCRLSPDTATEVKSLMRELQERWEGLAASLLRAQVTEGNTTGAHEQRGSGWAPHELRLLVQHVQAYQKASLRGFLELTYALDESLKDSQTVASAPQLETVQALFDDSSYGRPLGLKFVHASDWTQSGASTSGGMVVKAVVDSGAAAKTCPALSPGAVLVGINEKSVDALSYGQTSALLKVAGQARPLQLTFKQLVSGRSSHGSYLAGPVSGIRAPPTPARLTSTERDSLLEVLRHHSCLPSSELATVLAAHESDGYETICNRIAKVFGVDPRHERQQQISDAVTNRELRFPGPGGTSTIGHSEKSREDEVSTIKAELLSELEAQSALNAEWATKYEELELEVSTLNSELARVRAENLDYRTQRADAMHGHGRGGMADAVLAVAKAACETLDRRALLVSNSQDSVSIAEAMAEWRALLDSSRAGWRSDARVAASVSSLGSALEVTLSTIQQLGSSLNEAEEEVVQLRAELASVIDSHRSDPSAIGDQAQPIAAASASSSAAVRQSLETARAEITTLRAQLAQESSSHRGSSSPTRRAAAEATEAAAAARAQVGALRASLCQIVDEIDRLHLRAKPLANPTGDDEPITNSIGTPDRAGLGLQVQEVGASNTSMRADLAEVAMSLRKLGEISSAISASREELAASQREAAALQADLRDVRNGQAAAAEMHSKEEMAEKEAQIAELSTVIEQLETRWDSAQAMRKLAAGSAASETGSVETLLATNDQLTSQLTLMSEQIEQIMLRDTDVAAQTTQLYSP